MFWKRSLLISVLWLVCLAGCECEPWLKVTGIAVYGPLLCVECETGRYVQNQRNGTTVEDEAVSVVAFYLNDDHAELIGVAPRANGDSHLTLRVADGLRTPQALLAKGYVATESVGDRYLCVQSPVYTDRASMFDGPWIISDSHGQILATLPSLHGESYKAPVLLEHLLNTESKSVVFWNATSPLQPEPLLIKIWHYGQKSFDITSYAVDPSKAFRIFNCRYYSASALRKPKS